MPDFETETHRLYDRIQLLWGNYFAELSVNAQDQAEEWLTEIEQMQSRINRLKYENLEPSPNQTM